MLNSWFAATLLAWEAADVVGFGWRGWLAEETRFTQRRARRSLEVFPGEPIEGVIRPRRENVAFSLWTELRLYSGRLLSVSTDQPWRSTSPVA